MLEMDKDSSTMRETKPTSPPAAIISTGAPVHTFSRPTRSIHQLAPNMRGPAGKEGGRSNTTTYS